jgi:hypothetical protein
MLKNGNWLKSGQSKPLLQSPLGLEPMVEGVSVLRAVGEIDCVRLTRDVVV